MLRLLPKIGVASELVEGAIGGERHQQPDHRHEHGGQRQALRADAAKNGAERHTSLWQERQAITRLVPVHPWLIERGFIEFAQEARSPRVFASFELRKTANGESYGNAASSSFARFMDKIGMTDSTLKFHSFRHTFTDALRNAEVPYSSELAIVGHADKQNPVHGRYGSGRVKVDVLAKHVARVDPLA